MNVFLELLISLIVGLAILEYFTKKRREEAFIKAGIKGPKPLPLLGNSLLTINNTTSQIFEFLNLLKEEYGKISRMWFFGECVLMIQDAKDFESILSSQQVIKKNCLYDLLTCWLGNGLLLSNGSKWHGRRKIITPTFHFKILEQFVEVFDQQSCVLVERLQEKADGKTVLNMFPIVCLTALDIIAETAMGVKINAQKNPNFPYAKAVTDVADIFATRFMKATQRFDWFFKLTCYKTYLRMKKSIEIMHEFTDKVITERREALEKSIKNGTFVAMSNETNDLGLKKRMAFLDVLLQSTVADKPLTNEDIREEVDTFMFEGHDTTTSGISHTLYLLSRHPKVQQNVFEEILQVIGSDKNKPVTMRELQDLKYLDLVIKESLRMYPPVPMIGRITEHDVEINIFALFERLCKQFGKLYHLWLFHRVVIIIKEPKHLEVILSSQHVIKKPFIYDMLSCWLGDGLLLSYGPKWHARRKVLTPTYHFKILEQFIEIFDRQSHVFVHKLKEKADGKTSFNIFPYVCLAALDNISETAMGVKIGAQEHPEFPYAKAVKDATNILATRAVKPIYYYNILFMLAAFPSYLKLRKSIKIMHDFTTKVIKERKAAMVLQKPMERAQFDVDVGQKKRMAFLDVLLQATVDGKPLSLQDIREEVDTFMFEGHDTTTSGISFCLYLLSRHPSVQQRVFEEIIQVLGANKDDPICMQDLQNLKYLEAVIRETLRLYPSVPIIARHCLQDVQIGDQTIPANSNLVLLLYDVGRDPDYFPQPNEFNPERFYSESPDNIYPFAYVPFSAGPRNCIGQKFAMLEMKATISRLLRHYELLPLGEEVVQVLSLILRSVNGVQLGLRPRKY